MFNTSFEVKAMGAGVAELIGTDHYIDETGTGKILLTFLVDVEGIPQQDLQNLMAVAEEAITSYAVRHNLHVENTATIRIDAQENPAPSDEDISPWTNYLDNYDL